VWRDTQNYITHGNGVGTIKCLKNKEFMSRWIGNYYNVRRYFIKTEHSLKWAIRLITLKSGLVNTEFTPTQNVEGLLGWYLEEIANLQKTIKSKDIETEQILADRNKLFEAVKQHNRRVEGECDFWRSEDCCPKVREDRCDACARKWEIEL
jgi:hypothetical protein